MPVRREGGAVLGITARRFGERRGDWGNAIDDQIFASCDDGLLGDSGPNQGERRTSQSRQQPREALHGDDSFLQRV
jgi:hypothetical protein